MRSVLIFTALLLSNSAFATGNKCEKYQSSTRYTAAIKAVAAYAQYNFDELCTLETVLDIEAQPTRVITRPGEVIPHVRVQLHRAYDSCLYMVRDADLEITSARCYSGW